MTPAKKKLYLIKIGKRPSDAPYYEADRHGDVFVIRAYETRKAAEKALKFIRDPYPGHHVPAVIVPIEVPKP